MQGDGGGMSNLIMIRGDSNEYVLTLTDNAGTEYDLTGAAVSFIVGGLFTKTLGDGITVSDPTSGVAVIAVDPADTAGSPDQHTTYRYNVQITLADGRVKTPVRGLFIVLPDVT
jgi:hypothetical protein